jgi:hypothetical protein
MAADQRNFGYSQYVSDDGNTYCVKADAEWIANTDSGGAACTGQAPMGPQSSRRKRRLAVYLDGTTFRTVTEPVFTPTAYAALTVGTSTLAIHVPGETATVTYTLKSKIAEKVPTTLIGRTDPDHA